VQRQRLAAEAACLRTTRRLPEAVERLRRLYELSRHELEDGLTLCETQIRAGQRREALTTLAELRKEHPADREDARLAILEVEAFHAQEDYRNELAAAERAIPAARRQGMTQAEVRLLGRLALARVRAGSLATCPQALGELELARHRAEGTRDRFLLASVLQNLAVAFSTCEDPGRSEQINRQLIELYREIGAQGKLPPVLYNLGDDRLDAGDLLAADSLMREALETCVDHHSILCRERFLHPIGVNRLHRGELAEARRMIEEGMQRNLALGNRNRAAEARSFLPDLAFWSGDPARAVELQREVLKLREEIGIDRNIANAHSDLATWLAEAGRGAEAMAQARQAIALASGPGGTSPDACLLSSLASAELASGDLAAAGRDSARALALLPPPKNPFCSFPVWQVRTQVLLARGQLDAAEAAIGQGLELARRGGFVTYELQGRLFQAELALTRGRASSARHLATELAAEARAKGFGIIAQRCGRLISRAKGPAIAG